MIHIHGTLSKITFEQAVRQIVDLSSVPVGTYDKESIIGYMHTTAKNKMWTLAEKILNNVHLLYFVLDRS